MALVHFRRRSLIATTAAAMFAGAVWGLSRSQSDPRFVGEWQARSLWYANSCRWILRSNGTAEKLSSDGTKEQFHWRHEDDVLVFSEPTLVPRKLNDWCERAIGKRFGGLDRDRLETGSVEHFTLELMPGCGGPQKWTRAVD
jgi:hypothetical protein